MTHTEERSRIDVLISTAPRSTVAVIRMDGRRVRKSAMELDGNRRTQAMKR